MLVAWTCVYFLDCTITAWFKFWGDSSLIYNITNQKAAAVVSKSSHKKIVLQIKPKRKYFFVLSNKFNLFIILWKDLKWFLIIKSLKQIILWFSDSMALKIFLSCFLYYTIVADSASSFDESLGMKLKLRCSFINSTTKPQNTNLKRYTHTQTYSQKHLETN